MELSALDRFPARGKCKLLCASPLAGTVNLNNYKISALRGCKILIAFPQAELSILDRIPARGECKFLCASPLAGTVNRNNYKISACGDVKFWLHFRKRNCRFWIVFPRGGNVNFYVHLRLRGPWTEIMTKSLLAECNILIAFPQAVVSVLDRIPVRWKCRNFIAFAISIKILFNVLFSSCNRPVFLRVLLHVIVNCKLSIFDCFSFFFFFIYFFVSSLFRRYDSRWIIFLHIDTTFDAEVVGPKSWLASFYKTRLGEVMENFKNVKSHGIWTVRRKC